MEERSLEASMDIFLSINSATVENMAQSVTFLTLHINREVLKIDGLPQELYTTVMSDTVRIGRSV